ncbi:MAG TPA: outer membrane beta-barrel protein [Flavisolibacter sp.]
MKLIRLAWKMFLLTAINALALMDIANGQKIVLNGYGSYVLTGGYNSQYGSSDYLHGKTNDGLQVGGGIEYMISDKYGIEAMYLRRSTHAVQQSKSDPLKQLNFNLALNYILPGINVYLQPGTKKFQAFGSLFTGVVLENINFPGNAINSSVTKFAWAVRLGGKYWISDRVGVRVQTQWTSFFVMNEGLPPADIYGLNTANINFPIAYQFEVGTGVIVKLYCRKTK